MDIVWARLYNCLYFDQFCRFQLNGRICSVLVTAWMKRQKPALIVFSLQSGSLSCRKMTHLPSNLKREEIMCLFRVQQYFSVLKLQLALYILPPPSLILSLMDCYINPLSGRPTINFITASFMCRLLSGLMCKQSEIWKLFGPQNI